MGLNTSVLEYIHNMLSYIPLAIIILFWLSLLFTYKATKKKRMRPWVRPTCIFMLCALTICARHAMKIELYNTRTVIIDHLEKNKLKCKNCALWKKSDFVGLNTPLMNFSWNKKKGQCQLCCLDIIVKGLFTTFCISKTNIIASPDKYSIHCGEHWMLKKNAVRAWEGCRMAVVQLPICSLLL